MQTVRGVTNIENTCEVICKSIAGCRKAIAMLSRTALKQRFVLEPQAIVCLHSYLAIV